MYEDGLGVPEDDAEAVKWWRKAAEQGFALAQNNLAIKYATGGGIPEDFVQAYVWASLSKTGGTETASKILELLKKDMTKEQIAVAQALSSQIFQRIEARKLETPKEAPRGLLH